MPGTYYWRVQAFDNASGVSSPVSGVLAFSYQPFDLTQATIVSSPADFANWAETAKITSVRSSAIRSGWTSTGGIGPDRWPDMPFGDGSLEYTLGMCINIKRATGTVRPWSSSGSDGISARRASRATSSFEWFYDFARWGPMTGYQPQEGETVGFFVCAGNCRNNDAGDRSYVKERSNVAFVPWSNSGNGFFTFANGRRTR